MFHGYIICIYIYMRIFHSYVGLPEGNVGKTVSLTGNGKFIPPIKMVMTGGMVYCGFSHRKMIIHWNWRYPIFNPNKNGWLGISMNLGI